MACDTITAQTDLALNTFSARSFDAQEQFLANRRDSNWKLINVIFGIGLGTFLQAQGRNLNANSLGAAEFFETIGANLVSVSFAIPRVARIKTEDPNCNTRRLDFLQDQLFRQNAGACSCSQSRMDTYRQMRLMHELRLASQCTAQESTEQQKLLTESIGLIQKSNQRQ
eukprot:maker-scaffold96_size378025-snap-gene-2.37 protein:Tk04969 transcript:maker-scaffold96_size378025-snap-gene-2.37-mRNA-1 annotation:"Ceramidase"